MLKFNKAAENYEHVQRIFKLNDFEPMLGVEIGVRYADFSTYLLLNNRRLRLILVDPYLPYHDVGKDYTQEEQDKIENAAILKLARYNVLNRADFIYKSSVEAKALLAPEIRPDFVFIDAEHTFEACYADICAWAPLVIPGGLLMGHDYCMNGVGRAVTKWMDENNYTCDDLLHTGPGTDVWAIKLR